MTIKELEQTLEIPRATIRFYEKEGLINPKRKGNSYREYSESEVAVLKKTIILRKLGFSVSDIKEFLYDEVDFQKLLGKNILDLEEKMRELNGAIKVCRQMQERKENLESFDEEFYWKEIREEEKVGNKFLEIVNDVICFEKKTILKEFDLINDKGEMIYGIKESILRGIGTCLAVGLLWFFLDGKKNSAFIEGFFWPLTCILIYSIFGLPLYFLGKKHPGAAELIKKIGIGAAVVLLIILLIAAYVAQ